MYPATINTSQHSFHNTADAAPSKAPDKNQKAKEQSDLPPPYEHIYKHDGNFFTPDGKHKLLADPASRQEFMRRHKLNQKFLSSEDVAVIQDKTPVLIIDTSASMHKKVKKGATNVLGIMKNKLPSRETRLEEQKNEGIELLQMLEAFCAQKPSMYNLKGSYLGEASSASESTKRFYNDCGGGTPLSSTLDKVKADLSKTQDTHDIALYISTDGDPTDGGFDRNDRRLAFETRLRDLTDNGVTVQKSDGTSHTRTVGISMQYIGDDDEEYKYETRYDDSTPEKAAQSAKARMDEVRRFGSAGAYYSALDNERMGGIKRFDVNDDPASEINKAKSSGHKISRKEVTLKKMVGMLTDLDFRNESTPGAASASTASRVARIFKRR